MKPEAPVLGDIRECPCARCWRARNPDRFRIMIVCETCGNKRCPHATDHIHACTGSNEPGQPGSSYGPSLTEEAKSIVERLKSRSDIFDGASTGAGFYTTADAELDIAAIAQIWRLSKELADAKVNACAEDCLELNQQNARLTKRVEELENGLSMETAPLDGTAILLQSETGSLNIGWRSGDAWSYGGGQWADKLVIRWWPLPARTLLQSKANSEGGGQ